MKRYVALLPWLCFVYSKQKNRKKDLGTAHIKTIQVSPKKLSLFDTPPPKTKTPFAGVTSGAQIHTKRRGSKQQKRASIHTMMLSQQQPLHSKLYLMPTGVSSAAYSATLVSWRLVADCVAAGGSHLRPVANLVVSVPVIATALFCVTCIRRGGGGGVM